MPSVSRRQQQYLYASKGAAWVKAHGFDVLDPSAKGQPRNELANHMVKHKKKKHAKL